MGWTIAIALGCVAGGSLAQESAVERPSFDLIFIDEAPVGIPVSAQMPVALVLHAQPVVSHVTPQIGQDLLQDFAPPLLRELTPDAPLARLASLTPPTSGAPLSLDDRARIVGTDISPPVDAEPPQPALDDLAEMSPEDLARELQSELARVGCYRMRVDGQWGPGSRRSLSNYLTRSNQSADGQEPTPEIIRLVRASDGEICPAPVAAAPATPTPPRATTPARPPATTTVQRATPAPAPAPAAPSAGTSRLQGAIRGGLR